MRWLRQHFDTCFIVMQVWVDGLLVLFSCVLGYWLFKLVAFTAARPLAMYAQLMVVITGITLVCFWACGMYKWRKSILNVEEYRAAFKGTALALLITTAAIFLLKQSPAEQGLEQKYWIYAVLKPVHDRFTLDSAVEGTSRVLFLFIFIAVFVVTVIQRSLLFRVSSQLHAAGFGNTSVAVFGTGRLALQVQQKLRLFPTLGFNFLGFIDDDERLQGGSVRGFPVLGGRDQLRQLREKHGIRRLIIADDRLDEEELVGLCRLCEEHGIEYQVAPKLYHFFSQRFSVDKLDSIPLISVASAADQPLYHAVKRVLDVSVAAVVLVLAAPLMVVIAFLIQRESAGPIFFTQTRIGLKGQPFRIIKFRTMYVEMCGDEVTPRSSTDRRITKVGRYLRSSSLDELPQFWNVLRGDMSLVGPRPEMPFIVDTYSEVDLLRLDAKPGITGLWQVSEARNAPIHENLDYDLYYIDNQSIFLDLVILALTAATVLRPRATF
ncbi:MAG: sugar transferase [Planctomycetota bacterium]|nr:MAG: sugar transferase [Planctomycetota bacterium]